MAGGRGGGRRTSRPRGTQFITRRPRARHHGECHAHGVGGAMGRWIARVDSARLQAGSSYGARRPTFLSDRHLGRRSPRGQRSGERLHPSRRARPVFHHRIRQRDSHQDRTHRGAGIPRSTDEASHSAHLGHRLPYPRLRPGRGLGVGHHGRRHRIGSLTRIQPLPARGGDPSVVRGITSRLRVSTTTHDRVGRPGLPCRSTLLHREPHRRRALRDRIPSHPKSWHPLAGHAARVLARWYFRRYLVHQCRHSYLRPSERRPTHDPAHGADDAGADSSGLGCSGHPRVTGVEAVHYR